MKSGIALLAVLLALAGCDRHSTAGQGDANVTPVDAVGGDPAGSGAGSVVDSGTGGVADGGIGGVIDGGIGSVIDGVIDGVINGGTGGVVDSGTGGVVDSGTGGVVDSGTGGVVDSGTGGVVDSGGTGGGTGGGTTGGEFSQYVPAPGVTVVAAVPGPRGANVVLEPRTYTNFESPQTNPVRLSPDGSRLFAVNTPAGTLSVYSLAEPSAPTLIAEIPVGVEPVSVFARNNDEAWVVNHVSGTVSVVSVSRRIVVDTLAAGVEPSDVLVAGSPARVFVTASRDRAVRTFDPDTHAALGILPLRGEYPGMLAATPDGAHVYVLFSFGSNGTTIIQWFNNTVAEPAIPGLPPSPPVARIVDVTDPIVASVKPSFTLLDHDVAEIDTATDNVRYFGGTGTVNFGIAVDPSRGRLYVSNTEAHNRTFFLPDLRGRFVSNRLSGVDIASGGVASLDLNPDIDLAVQPNPSGLATALAQPAGILVDPSAAFLWVAAFGTDRIARVSLTDGAVLARMTLGGAAVDSAHKRGPRGMALAADGSLLYVQNAISNTISVIDTARLAVIREFAVGTYDPTPPAVRKGRGFFYDARLSGTGTVSCASCHVDGRTDYIGWNLGDPDGTMRSIVDPVTGSLYYDHPMKGPKTTQILSGLMGQQAFHWRGDVPDLTGFNELFAVLMGGSRLSAANMQLLADFIAGITMLPNPNLELDGALKADLGGFHPAAGAAAFQADCAGCHGMPGVAEQVKIIQRPNGQALKVATLRHVYEKTGYQVAPGTESYVGFGVMHDGDNAPALDSDTMAFLLSRDTGTAPTVGHSLTVTAAGADDPALLSRWQLLETQARQRRNDLFVHGALPDGVEALLYQPVSGLYASCSVAGRMLTRAQLQDAARTGAATLTLVGLPPGNAACARAVSGQ